MVRSRPTRPTVIGLVPARAGSQRIKGKNVRPLLGHPLIAYTIASAVESGVFSQVIVSTDSTEYAAVARHYGADVPFLRPSELAGPTSPDIDWIRHALSRIRAIDAFAILRPTSPFRSAGTLGRAWERFLGIDCDSMRAVERVRQHPGKMWVVAAGGESMHPLLDQANLPLPWHSQQTQALQPVHVQNSSLEIVWAEAVARTGKHAGDIVGPFLTEGVEGFSLDYEDEWTTAQNLIAAGKAVLPAVRAEPFRSAD